MENSDRWFDLALLPNEEFRDIKGYENLYQISNYGRVKSLKRNVLCGNRYNNKKKKRTCQEKILRLTKDKDGYYRIGLYKKPKRAYLIVHRLIAEAFIPNPNDFPCINHKDEVKTNNSIDNLEWCTVAYNNAYGNRTENAKLKLNKPVLQLDRTLNLLNEYKSVADASMKTNTCRSSIYGCCNNKEHFKTANGYIWKYKEEK